MGRMKFTKLLSRAAHVRPALLDGLTSKLQQHLRETLPQGGLSAGFLKQVNVPGVSRAPALDLPQGAAFLAGTFACAQGSRPYRLYVPAHAVRDRALIVMLHGCTQTAEDFAAGTRMNALAERAGALVLYPVQVSQANAQRCWNWFQPQDQAAGQGEPAIIAGMVREVMAEHRVLSGRVFVAGLSAGGAQAAIMARAYPDLFAGVGVHSGLACGAAHDTMSAFTAMRQGHAGRGQIGVPAIVFHGDRDGTVNIANAAEIAAQVRSSGEGRTEQGQVPGGLSWTRMVQPGRGRITLEQWVVHGLGHAWSGGDAAGSYTEPRGPDASEAMLRFFLQAADHQ